MHGSFTLSVPVTNSARVMQASGMFDIPPSERSEFELDFELPIEERPWNVGLIVGPSGSGKSSLARGLWPDLSTVEFKWPTDRSVLDGFPEGMSIKEIIDLMSSVGFSSPPSWVRPFHVLSTGEQFRVNTARALAEGILDAASEGEERRESTDIVFDEFTSVVDRTVAQIGSSAIARTVRRRNLRFVAVTCHYDVEDWLQPDWVFGTDGSGFRWRSVQSRPGIQLEIRRVHYSLWDIFSKHHYLDRGLNHSAACFGAFYKGRPVAFNAWLSQPHRSIPNLRRSSRVVTLPDYQGVGIGNALVETVASMWKALGYRAMATAAHPAMVGHRARSPLWMMHRDPSRNSGGGMMARDARMGRTIANTRLTAGFEYVGPAMDPLVAKALQGGEHER